MLLLVLLLVVFHFNSIKVQLEHFSTVIQYDIFANFNSIKVQLELQKANAAPTTSQFQFHKGTIRTFVCRL